MEKKWSWMTWEGRNQAESLVAGEAYNDVTWLFVLMQWEARCCYMIVCLWWYVCDDAVGSEMMLHDCLSVMMCLCWCSGKQDAVTWLFVCDDMFVLMQWEARCCYMIVCDDVFVLMQWEARWCYMIVCLWWCNGKQDDVTWLFVCDDAMGSKMMLHDCDDAVGSKMMSHDCDDAVGSKMLLHDCLSVMMCLCWCSGKQDDVTWLFVCDDAMGSKMMLHDCLSVMMQWEARWCYMTVMMQ